MHLMLDPRDRWIVIIEGFYVIMRNRFLRSWYAMASSRDGDVGGVRLSPLHCVTPVWIDYITTPNVSHMEDAGENERNSEAGKSEREG